MKEGISLVSRAPQKEEKAKKVKKSSSSNSLDSVEFLADYILKTTDPKKTPQLLDRLVARLRESGVNAPSTVSTDYVNTIPPEKEVPFPGVILIIKLFLWDFAGKPISNQT